MGKTRCQCLGVLIGLTLALSVSATAEWSAARAEPVMVATVVAANPPAVSQITVDHPAPAPVPLILLAVALVALAATLRYRRRPR